MIYLLIGIAIGAAFSTFWISLWESFKKSAVFAKVKGWFTN